MSLYLTNPTDPTNTEFCTKTGQVVFKSICPSSPKPRTATLFHALPNLEPTPDEVLWAEKHFAAYADSEAHSHSYYSSTSSSSTSFSSSTTLDNEIIEERRDPGRPSSFDSWHDHKFHWSDSSSVPLQSPVLADLEHLRKAAVETESHTRFSEVASIEFHTILSSVIRYKGKEWKTSEFFKREGKGWYGSDRLFSGEDGMTYIWKLEKNVSELFLLDSDPHEKHGKAHVPLLVARYVYPPETNEQQLEKKEKASHQPNQKQTPACINIFPAGEHVVDLIILTFLYIERLRIQRISHHQSPHNKGDNNHAINKQGLKNGTNSRRQSPMINLA